MHALLLVDIQNDFCPGGALAVTEGDAVVPVANALISRFPLTVLTQDHHPAGHSSFAAQGGPWPPHCIQGTPGAAFHPDLDHTPANQPVVPKGERHPADSYSGFADDDGVETGLHALLQARGVDALTVLGLATDYCVKATVLHALERGYDVDVVVDGCRAVDLQPGDGEAALDELAAAGARLVHSADLLDPEAAASA